MRVYCIIKIRTLLILLNLITLSYSAWQCGHVLGNANANRIVGGWSVGYLKYQWYAALVQDDFVYCGGTLIAPKYVVSAAHCYKEPLHKNMSLEKIYDVKLGINNRCIEEPTQKRFTVDKVFIHEEYYERDPYFDISLILLTANTDGFMPCCLPHTALSNEQRGKEAYIAGLGNLKYKAPEPPCTLHEARVKIYTDNECRDMLNKAEDAGDQFINGLCAGYLDGGIDTCQGDSGGPLMVIGKHSEYILLGITSFGYECAAKDVLGMYTDVSRYIDWLSTKMIVNPTAGSPVDTPVTKPEDDWPWIVNNDNGTNVQPIAYPNGYPPTVIIHVHKKKKKHHHLIPHLFKKNSKKSDKKFKELSKKHTKKQKKKSNKKHN